MRSGRLSYFSAHSIPKGSIVSVPIRAKKTPALVVHTEEVRSAKTQIRSGNFAIKKIARKKHTKLLLEQFVRAAEKTAHYHAAPIGTVLHRIVPKSILTNIDKAAQAVDPLENSESVATEKLILQQEPDARLSYYKNLVREEFARSRSVYIVVPTIRDGERIHNALKKGIEGRAWLLSSALSKKDTLSSWNDIVSSERPVLVVATGMFLSIPRKDIGTIVIEREQSNLYKTQERPKVDFCVFAEHLAEELHARLIFADFPPRIDSIWRYHNKELDEVHPVKLRVGTTSEVHIVDMRNTKESSTRFEVLSTELKKTIQEAGRFGKRVFLYTTRRGIASSTICKDCGNTVLCRKCGAAVVLHRSRPKNVFVCHACGTSRSAHERCKTCTSFRLEPLGIGTERVLEACKDAFPDMPQFIVDSSHTKTHKQASSTIEKFYSTHGGILIGTEMALPYLTKPIEKSAVISIDTLLSLPHWNIHEKVFATLIRIRAITNESIHIQTRMPEQTVLEHAAGGSVADFYRHEVEERKRLLYPPFTTIITITREGTKAVIAKDIKIFEKLLSEYSPHIFPTRGNTKGAYRLNTILKIPRGVWVSKPLEARLADLPPQYIISVNPDSVL